LLPDLPQLAWPLLTSPSIITEGADPRDLTLLLIYVGATLGISFLCSLLEAALLSVPIGTLAERRESGRGARHLFELKSERIDDAISAILTLNTISNTLGATLAGAQAHKITDDFWVGVFSGILTFLILTISEIIPKTIGATYSRSLIGFVGYVLAFLTRVMAPILVFTRALTRLLTRGETVGISRGELEAIIDMAATTGDLQRHEKTLYQNVLRLDEIRIGDVMTPRTVCWMLPGETTIEEFLGEPEGRSYTRIPLYRGNRDEVTGYLFQRDVLRAVAEGRSRQDTLQEYQREVRYLPEVATLRKALTALAEGRESMAMVADEHGGTCGLVTVEDIFETILGVEIVDEVDEVADLRDRAQSLRDQRLSRMEDRRQLRLPREPEEEEEPPAPR
jgi:CBS domain containing-hemolysin-like protein